MRCDLTIFPLLIEAAYFSFFSLESDMLMHTIDYNYKSVFINHDIKMDLNRTSCHMWTLFQYTLSGSTQLSHFHFPSPSHMHARTHTSTQPPHTHTHTRCPIPTRTAGTVFSGSYLELPGTCHILDSLEWLVFLVKSTRTSISNIPLQFKLTTKSNTGNVFQGNVEKTSETGWYMYGLSPAHTFTLNWTEMLPYSILTPKQHIHLYWTGLKHCHIQQNAAIFKHNELDWNTAIFNETQPFSIIMNWTETLPYSMTLLFNHNELNWNTAIFGHTSKHWTMFGQAVSKALTARVLYH